MGEMRERIARALCKSDRKDPDSHHFAGKLLWEAYVHSADAVLNALREPTPEMVKAGYTANSYPIAGLAHSFAPTPVWQAMIDSILGDN